MQPAPAPVFAPGPRVRVLIADSDADARRRLRNVLEAESDFDVVGEADDGPLALQLARWLRPSVMLLDPHLRGLPGSDLAKALTTEIPEVRVVLLTGTST